LPAPKLLPSHIVGIISLAVIALALAARFAFHYAGAWRWIYAVTMGVAIYLNFFVLVTQLFLKVGFLHALAPHAPDNPEPPFLIAQAIVLVIFVWLIWRAVRNFRGADT
jgi:predicted neutral ceramidase superfamily lipid hydrolase